MYSDPIHHALAFAAKHFPVPVSRYDGDSGLIKTANVAVILSRYGADESTIAAAILKQLVDAAPFTAQATLARQIIGKFGPEVAFAVEGAAEPRFDMSGRERTWKATRMEYLSRILEAGPSSVDLCVAEEIHRAGTALTAIRRLGVEYLESGTPTPTDTVWWLGSLVGTISTHPRWHRPEMRSELDRLATELARRIADS